MPRLLMSREIYQQLKLWGQSQGIEDVVHYMHECHVDLMDIIGIPSLREDGGLRWHAPRIPHTVLREYGFAVRDENGQARLLKAPV